MSHRSHVVSPLDARIIVLILTRTFGPRNHSIVHLAHSHPDIPLHLLCGVLWSHCLWLWCLCLLVCGVVVLGRRLHACGSSFGIPDSALWVILCCGSSGGGGYYCGGEGEEHQSVTLCACVYPSHHFTPHPSVSCSNFRPTCFLSVHRSVDHSSFISLSSFTVSETCISRPSIPLLFPVTSQF